MKICFKCGIEKPILDFYRHSQMADGHLNKCKTCTRKDTRDRTNALMAIPEFRESEYLRHRLKTRRQRALGILKESTPEIRKIILEKHAYRYPEKTKSRQTLSNAIRDGKIEKKPCEVCGDNDSEGHHDDYSKPLDVIWLCPKHHAERHVELRKQDRLKKDLECHQKKTI